MNILRIALSLLVATVVLSVHAAYAEPKETEKDRPSDGLAIRAQLRAWNKALLEGDYDALSEVLSDDYFESEGVTRELYSKLHNEAGINYTESSRENLDIRFYGDTAVVASQWTSRGTTGQFGGFSSTSRMTNVWVKQGGKWKCVAVSPDDTRKAFARVGQVRVGPDVPAEIVVLFGAGAANQEIEAFRLRHLSPDSEPSVPVASYTASGSVGEHPVVALKLGTGVSDVEKKFLVERLLNDSAVFRVFENMAPSKITLGE